MKRSEINALIRDASRCFAANGWALPPKPRWDVTDFGLGVWRRYGLVLINLAEQLEYCEKLMYAKKGMTTPSHCHAKKKEDIICRAGVLRIQFWSGKPDQSKGKVASLLLNGEETTLASGEFIDLTAGSRVTIRPGVYHEFFPTSEECIIGEVSTANDDLHDNFFVNPDVGRYPNVEEDEPALVRLLSDQ